MRYILIIIALIGGWAAYTNRAGVADEFGAKPDRYPADHIIHITAKLEFDGKPVVIDDLIDCLAEGRGTPTQSAHLTFRLSRNQIVAEIPGGGSIAFRTSRQMCYAYGNKWGDTFDELTVPDGWTPVIEWSDHRDPRQAQEGIMYLSETALNAANGRLRIIENFRITIPEYPASEALIAEAEMQAVERDYWMGDVDARKPGVVGSMVEIPESMWRNPDPMFARTSIHQSEDTNFRPMIEYLDDLTGDEGLLPLGWTSDAYPKQVLSGILSLQMGRRLGYGDYFEYGIPRTNTDRFGLLISAKAAERFGSNPISLDRFDERIPWTCSSGVASPDFDNPGLVNLYRKRCIHPDHYKGTNWEQREFVNEWAPTSGNLIFDLESKSLWVLSLWN